MERKAVFSGIFPPVATPFMEDGDLDLSGLEKNIMILNQTPLKGYVVLGSNGEYIYLTWKEKLKTIESILKATGDDKIIIVGTGCESLQETIELTTEAGRMGVHGALVITPHFYKGGMTPKVLENYYLQVAEKVEIPVLIYNVPKNTGLNLSPSLVSILAKHPNIVGIKDSSGNIAQLGEIIRSTTQEDFAVLVGTASVLSSAISLGAVGGILALANIAPEDSVKIMDFVQNGQYEEARLLQLKMLPVNTAVTATYGVPGLKYAMDLLGYRGGYPRQPLLPLSEEEKESVRKILVQGGLL